MKIQLKHKDSGLLKEPKIGFSWTTLFFGLFVPLFRGDIKWAVISFVFSIVTLGLFWLIFPFIYNKIYIKSLLKEGFIPANDESRKILLEKGWIKN
jgi:hypothetical protein